MSTEARSFAFALSSFENVDQREGKEGRAFTSYIINYENQSCEWMLH